MIEVEKNIGPLIKESVNGRRVLFFSPSFFGYELAIKEKLESLGAIVDFFDERPSNSAWVKALIRLNRRLLHSKIHSYFSKIISQLPVNSYDFVFVIKMESMPKYVLEKLRSTQNNATFIYYSYDSVKNNHNALTCLGLFDSAFTFDRQDAKEFGMRCRPLFFLDVYRNLPQVDIQYEWCFIGTAHSDRYALIKHVYQVLKSYQLQAFVFLYVPSKLLFWIKKVFLPLFWFAKPSEFSFIPINKESLINCLAKSKAVLDFQHPKQTGLTMRTIEMLGAKKKLITTNADIKNYDFYQEENIMIVDRQDIKIDIAFFNVPYCEIKSEVYEKYSIDGWLSEIFGNNG